MVLRANCCGVSPLDIDESSLMGADGCCWALVVSVEPLGDVVGAGHPSPVEECFGGLPDGGLGAPGRNRPGM